MPRYNKKEKPPAPPKEKKGASKLVAPVTDQTKLPAAPLKVESAGTQPANAGTTMEERITTLEGQLNGLIALAERQLSQPMQPQPPVNIAPSQTPTEQGLSPPPQQQLAPGQIDPNTLANLLPLLGGGSEDNAADRVFADIGKTITTDIAKSILRRRVRDMKSDIRGHHH